MLRLLAALAILAIAPSAQANRGHFPHKPNVRLFEPTQRAMIAWNGVEQLLVLSTDLRASEPTRVLEVLPCPSEPRVAKGDIATFERATRVINRHLRARAPKRKSRSRSESRDALSPAGEVTFHAKIGAHDVSVTHVLSAARFVDWVASALRKAGVKDPVIPSWAKQAVQRYIDEGFAWFVFDTIDVGPELKTAQPLRYRFATDRLYYPLRITKVHGSSTVDLVVLTPRLLSRFPGVPAKRIQLAHDPFSISLPELTSIDEEMADMLGRKPATKLRIWKLFDPGGGFSEDLIAH